MRYKHDRHNAGVRQISRRSVCTLPLLGLAAWLTGCAARDAIPPEQSSGQLAQIRSNLTTADVVVIGAGAAGLGAARLLKAQGYDVLLLEARDRIGGRVWTAQPWNELPLDLGASWIHGTEGNPVAELARQSGIATANTDYNELWLYDSQGELLEEADQIALDELLDEVLAEVRALAEESESELNLQQLVEQVLTDYELSASERQALNYALNTGIEHEFAADLSELSGWYWDEGRQKRGADVLFPGGYDQIITALADGLNIRLGQVVRQISHDASGVRVSSTGGVVLAERAVITLPLGVLKRGTVTFSPALPPRKQAAIQNLGMGLLNKVFLRFPRVFWPEESHLLGYIAANKGEWGEWLNIFHYTGAPVLLGFNAGSYARQLETLSDEAIVAAAMQPLRAMFGARTPDPEAWAISRWAADPFAGGAYSYLPFGASDADYAALAAPVDDRLFFAGEATSRAYAATVHGALLSGEAAARRIIELG